MQESINTSKSPVPSSSAPPESGRVSWRPPAGYVEPGRKVLGRTVPFLLEEACRLNPNPRAFNTRQDEHWTSLSSQEFRDRCQCLALGFLDLDLARGDRVCLFMRSDTTFCLADMACLTAGLVDVPIYLTHTPNTIRYVLDHAQARALIASDCDLLADLLEAIDELPRLKSIILGGEEGLSPEVSRAVARKGIEVHSLRELEAAGRRRLDSDPEAGERLQAEIHPSDLATIVYTSGTTGRPKGVMLTHENLSFDTVAAFTGLEKLERGGGHVTLSFLPLTHVFARMMQYGYMNYGLAVYFTEPDRIASDLKSVRPAVFATVPRVIEKFYDRILEKGDQLGRLGRGFFKRALRLARSYEMGKSLSRWARIQRPLLDRMVFSRWREALGGRLELIICGGAALRPDLANVFAAAGIEILQGYGLTETSPVISFNRPDFNRAGTVGIPLAGVEVALAPDGEILTRGPHVMKGYYRDPGLTRQSMDSEGWFYTGDVGEFTEDGLLKITDRKKDLFKLSTGKYVMPLPLETRLVEDPLVDQAVVVGEGRKFCSVLIFPETGSLERWVREAGVDGSQSLQDLLESADVQNYFQQLIERTNSDLPPWSSIKKFDLIAETLSSENGFLTPTLKVRRNKVRKDFADRIDSLYGEEEAARDEPPTEPEILGG